MSLEFLILMTCAIAVIAFLYSSVGHAGASGYIAVMALAGFAQTEIRPIALVLNIVVATITSWQFFRAGHFSFSLFWPFAVLSIPCAFLGGSIKLPNHVFDLLIGAVLIFCAVRFLGKPTEENTAKPPCVPLALSIGAVLGLFAGLTGTGGGIFLTPLLLLMKWARTKQAAAASALFILTNSISGLLGNFSSTQYLPRFTWGFVAAALLGGFIGSTLGSQRFSHGVIKKMLACVLIVAGGKLILTFF
ncbi:MAG: sulfite exporter TauE/SafE family protein [Verrucomicrobia bacterium]|nr:MAG: sulfite exporter TauE/SafE family protein [Verrucomicrobiota bacterium]